MIWKQDDGLADEHSTHVGGRIRTTKTVVEVSETHFWRSDRKTVEVTKQKTGRRAQTF